MWRDTRSTRVWWHASATALFGVGCTKTRFAPGSTAAGYFRAIHISRPRLDESWTCTSDAGKERLCARTSSSSRPTRRQAFRRACASIQACQPHRPRQCAWSMSTPVAVLGRSSRQGVRPLRSNYRHRALRASGRSGHEPSPLQHCAPGVLGHGQWFFPSWRGVGPTSHTGPSTIGAGSRPGARELAQPDRNLLLNYPAQGSDSERLCMPAGHRRAAEQL